VSVGIDQVAYGGVAEGGAGGRDEQEAIILAEVGANDRLDTDGSAIELDLDLTSTSETDTLPE
jgi:hypothetical protein